MKVLSHLSGGFDSAASTLLVAESGAPFFTLMVDLGQPYLDQEIKSAAYMQDFLKAKYPNYLGHRMLHVDMALGQDGQVSAYIPVRNLVIGSMSANLAVSLGCDTIAVGNKTLELRPEDPYCFNDCSREFYTRLGDLASFASQGFDLKFIMPLIVDGIPVSKHDLVVNLIEKGVDVKQLWSCYADTPEPCGECHHCKELKAANVWHLITEAKGSQ